MDTISTLNAIKSVFAALGAKTSDSNYAVPLVDKTSAEPKGFMEMANLASVLGGTSTKITTSALLSSYKTIGTYNIETSQIASNIEDVPVESGGVLVVSKGHSSSFVFQEYRTLSEVYIRRVSVSDSTASDWSRLDNFGCKTANELASLLGGLLNINYYYFGSGNASETVEKATNRQGLLYCCVNAGQPSLFAFDRTSITSTIVEGSIKATDISISGSGTEIVITKGATKHLYVTLLGF